MKISLLPMFMIGQRRGLALAGTNNADTMKGIFNFFIAKAFAYRYLKPRDNAIVYYKKVLPLLFRIENEKYNVYSSKEKLWNDMLNGRIKTLLLYILIL